MPGVANFSSIGLCTSRQHQLGLRRTGELPVHLRSLFDGQRAIGDIALDPGRLQDHKHSGGDRTPDLAGYPRAFSYDYAVDLIQRGVLKQLTSRRWIPRAFQLSGASGSSELVKAIFDNLPPTNTEAASAILMSAATSGNDEIVRITMQWIRQSQIHPKRQKQMIDWVAADVAREGKPETLKILKDEGPK